MSDRQFRCGEWVWVWDGDFRSYKVVGPEGDAITLQTSRDGRLMFFNVHKSRVWRTRRNAEEAVRRDMAITFTQARRTRDERS